MRTRRACVCLLAIGAIVASGCSGDGGSDKSSAPSTTTRAARAVPLVGTSWTLTAYRSGGTTTTATPEPPATLTFAASGQLSGSTGCNSFGGSYTTNGNQLSITLGGMTLIGCTDAALQAQERAITTQLPKVTAYRISGTTLTLTGAGSAELFAYRAVTNSLTGRQWSVTGVNNGRGAVESTALTEKLTAAFDANQTFSGFGGCNQMTGPYKVSGNDGLTIGPLASTRKSCGDAIDQLEAEYSAALSRVTVYEISGSTLTMRDSGGAIQVTANRG